MDFKLWCLLCLMTVAGAQKKGKPIWLSPQDTEVVRYLNETLSMSCLTPNGLHTMWTKPSEEQITQTRGRVHVEDGRASERGLALVFEAITMKDRGNYTCTATVDGVEVRAGFRLVVIKPISFMDTSPLQFARENQNMLVRCEVEGDPEPTVVWQVKGKTPEGPKYRVMADGLFISNVTLDDSGEYQCRAFQLSSVTSSVVETKITLKIQHKPMWPEKPQSSEAYGFISGVTNLTCEVIAEPAAEFQWLRDNRTLSKSTVAVVNDTQRSVLTLSVSNASVFGNYTCRATNILGSIERVVTLREGNKPDPPGVTTKGYTADTITLVVVPPPADDLPIEGYKVQYRRQDQDWSASLIMYFRHDGQPLVVTALSHDTLYYLRIAARNAAGYSDFCPDVKQRTKRLNAEHVLDMTKHSVASVMALTPFLLQLAIAMLHL